MKVGNVCDKCKEIVSDELSRLCLKLDGEYKSVWVCPDCRSHLIYCVLETWDALGGAPTPPPSDPPPDQRESGPSKLAGGRPSERIRGSPTAGERGQPGAGGAPEPVPNQEAPEECGAKPLALSPGKAQRDTTPPANCPECGQTLRRMKPWPCHGCHYDPAKPRKEVEK